MDKTCCNCQYRNRSTEVFPCLPCDAFSYWHEKKKAEVITNPASVHHLYGHRSLRKRGKASVRLLKMQR